MRMRELTPQQALFVVEFPKDFNATAAAKRAGYSPRSASRLGFDLLKKSQVQSEIVKALDRAVRKCELSTDFVLTRLMALADSDLTELVDWETPRDLRVRPKAELSGAQRRTLKKIKHTTKVMHHKDGSVETSYCMELEARDPIPALRMLGQWLEMWAGGLSDDPPSDPTRQRLLSPEDSRALLQRYCGRAPQGLIGAIPPVQEAEPVSPNGNGKGQKHRTPLNGNGKGTLGKV